MRGAASAAGRDGPTAAVRNTPARASSSRAGRAAKPGGGGPTPLPPAWPPGRRPSPRRGPPLHSPPLPSRRAGARRGQPRTSPLPLPAPAGGGSSAAAPQSEHLPSCPPGAGCCCCFAAAGRPGWARREGTGCAASRVPGARLCLTAGRGAAAGRAGLSAGGGPAPLRSPPLPGLLGIISVCAGPSAPGRQGGRRAVSACPAVCAR